MDKTRRLLRLAPAPSYIEWSVPYLPNPGLTSLPIICFIYNSIATRHLICCRSTFHKLSDQRILHISPSALSNGPHYLTSSSHPLNPILPTSGY